MSEHSSNAIEQTPEAVAYRLLLEVIRLEASDPNIVKNREYLLSTYEDCYKTVKGGRGNGY